MALPPPTDYEHHALDRLLGGALPKPEYFERFTLEEKLATLKTILAECQARANKAWTASGCETSRWVYEKNMSDYHLALSDKEVVWLAIKRLEELA